MAVCPKSAAPHTPASTDAEPAAQDLPGSARSRSPIVERLLAAAGAGASSRSPLCYLHTAFAHCGLPRRQMAVRQFSGENGDWRITLSAGALSRQDGGEEPQPLPYGSRARLMLMHLTTVAVQKQQTVLDLPASMGGLLHDLGHDRNGKRIDHGGKDRARLAEQMAALLATDISVFRLGQPIFAGRAFLAAEPWRPPERGRASLWPSQVEVGPDYIPLWRDLAGKTCRRWALQAGG